MKIYVGHSRDFDYQNELYAPLRNSELNHKHQIILPHEKSEKMLAKETIEYTSPEDLIQRLNSVIV